MTVMIYISHLLFHLLSTHYNISFIMKIHIFPINFLWLASKFCTLPRGGFGSIPKKQLNSQIKWRCSKHAPHMSVFRRLSHMWTSGRGQSCCWCSAKVGTAAFHHHLWMTVIIYDSWHVRVTEPKKKSLALIWSLHFFCFLLLQTIDLLDCQTTPA